MRAHELLESRSAPLFHGTELANALMILQSDLIEATQDDSYSNDPPGVSLSRNYKFAMSFGSSRDTGYGVVFVLDQAKLTTRFRMKPHVAVSDWGDVITGEEEEIVLARIQPLSRYLVSINTDPQRLHSLLDDGEEFQRWFRNIGDLLGYPGRDRAHQMLTDLSNHPLLNRYRPRLP